MDVTLQTYIQFLRLVFKRIPGCGFVKHCVFNIWPSLLNSLSVFVYDLRLKTLMVVIKLIDREFYIFLLLIMFQICSKRPVKLKREVSSDEEILCAVTKGSYQQFR